MNNKMKTDKKLSVRRWDGKIKDFLIISVLAIVLLFAAWKIFRTDDTQDSRSMVSMSEKEEKVARLLQEIKGVGEADVIICESEEEEILSVVVVCEGANDFKVTMDVREAVAAALGTEEKVVKIYLKKE